MTNEQCDNVAEKAWSLANKPGTNFSASVALKDCAFTIKELQSRIAEFEKDAMRYQWLRDNCHYSNILVNIDGAACGYGELDIAIDTAMQND